MDGAPSRKGRADAHATSVVPEAETGSFETLRSLHEAQRHLIRLVPNVRTATGGGSPLERLERDMELPHVIDAEGAEDATLRARPVRGLPVPAIRAFLDGTQRSQVIGWGL